MWPDKNIFRKWRNGTDIPFYSELNKLTVAFMYDYYRHCKGVRFKKTNFLTDDIFIPVLIFALIQLSLSLKTIKKIDLAPFFGRNDVFYEITIYQWLAVNSATNGAVAYVLTHVQTLYPFYRDSNSSQTHVTIHLHLAIPCL